MIYLITKDMATAEILKLVREGQQLRCPQCGSIVKTIPENWKSGMPFYGIECPNEQRHFMIHCDNESAMKEMRVRMKRIKTKENKN
jgi:hypothetical protein